MDFLSARQDLTKTEFTPFCLSSNCPFEERIITGSFVLKYERDTVNAIKRVVWEIH